jgi:hypothetical protein
VGVEVGVEASSLPRRWAMSAVEAVGGRVMPEKLVSARVVRVSAVVSEKAVVRKSAVMSASVMARVSSVVSACGGLVSTEVAGGGVMTEKVSARVMVRVSSVVSACGGLVSAEAVGGRVMPEKPVSARVVRVSAVVSEKVAVRVSAERSANVTARVSSMVSACGGVVSAEVVGGRVMPWVSALVLACGSVILVIFPSQSKRLILQLCPMSTTLMQQPSSMVTAELLRSWRDRAWIPSTYRFDL